MTTNKRPGSPKSTKTRSPLQSLTRCPIEVPTPVRPVNRKEYQSRISPHVRFDYHINGEPMFVKLSTIKIATQEVWPP